MPDNLLLPRGVRDGQIIFTVAFFGTLDAVETVDDDDYPTNITTSPTAQLFNGSDVSVAGPYNTTTSPAITRTSQGNYSLEFSIPLGWVVAEDYYIRWSVTIEGNLSTFDQIFAVSADSIDISQFGSSVTGYAKTLIDNYLYSFLGDAMDLEVHSEVGRRISSTQIRFNHTHWRNDFTPELYKNEQTLLEMGTDYTLEFDDGVTTLTTALVDGDEIEASYRFMYFTMDELWSYLDETIAELNSIKPNSFYDIDSAPKGWNAALLMGAKIKSIEKMLFDRQIWRDFLIWSDGPGARESLQGLYSALLSRYSTLTDKRHFKRRGAVLPRAVTSGKYYTPQLVDNINFWNYTIMGSSVT